MGIETMFLVSAGMQLASGFMQYSEQKKADRAAEQAAAAQARLQKEDADAAALDEQRQAQDAQRKQRMAYLTSGVDLTGSPLLVMEETRNKGDENAKNVKDRGYAQANLTYQQGSIKRANLVGTVLDTAKGIAGSYSDYKTLSMLTSKPNSTVVGQQKQLK